MTLRLKNLISMFMLVILFGMMSSCGGNDTPSTQDNLATAQWKTSSSVNAQASTAAIILTGLGGTSWSATISQGSSFCSFNYSTMVSGTQGVLNDGLNVLYLYYSANTSADTREAVIDITFGDAPVQQLTLVQTSASENDQPQFSSWAELPVEKSSDNYQYVTHYVELGTSQVRNYSICFDKTKKAALWVAYPLHNAYLGSTNRTDAWAFDPYVSQTLQADCINRSYTGDYDRGHQLPSADRLANFEMNAQTFYMSNMTPQLNRLNQDMWAKLETKVRNNRCSDTLYVVTGAYFGTGASTTTDGAGNVVPIPTHYFKVLLRTKSGNTGKSIAQCTDSELISIGFWVEQKSYGNIEPPTSICTTVAAIEAQTGFIFFPQVSSAVKSQNAPSVWGIN